MARNFGHLVSYRFFAAMQTLPLLNKGGGTYEQSLHLELQLHNDDARAQLSSVLEGCPVENRGLPRAGSCVCVVDVDDRDS